MVAITLTEAFKENDKDALVTVTGNKEEMGKIESDRRDCFANDIPLFFSFFFFFQLLRERTFSPSHTSTVC